MELGIMIGVWKYWDDEKFVDFSKELNEQMEIFYQEYLFSSKKNFIFPLKIGKYNYTIDFKNNQQTNTLTNCERKIHRDTPSVIRLKRPPTPIAKKIMRPATIVWEIKYLTKELWLPFHKEGSEYLEKKLQKFNMDKTKKFCDIDFRGITFHINLETFTHNHNKLGYTYYNIRRIELKEFEINPTVTCQKIDSVEGKIDLKFPFNKYEIYKVKNDDLYRKYKNEKKKGIYTERYFFHGTKQVYLNRILNEGFSLPSTDDGLLGKIIYMCDNMKKALQYCDPEFQIIIGAKCLFNQNEVIEFHNIVYKEFGFPKPDMILPKFLFCYKSP